MAFDADQTSRQVRRRIARTAAKRASRPGPRPTPIILKAAKQPRSRVLWTRVVGRTETYMHATKGLRCRYMGRA
jgi:hypothetical protein